MYKEYLATAKQYELDNIVKKQYEQLINSIITKDIDGNRGIGLYTGLSGDLVILANHYISCKSEIALERTGQLLNATMSRMMSDHFQPLFSSGWAGFLYTINFLRDLNILDSSQETFFNALKEKLSTNIPLFLEDRNSDLLNGAMGISMPFIFTGDFERIKPVFNYIYETQINDGKQIYWSINKRLRHNRDYVDFGLAHGEAGILYFLNKCLQGGFEKEKCVELIEGILRFYETNIQDHYEIGSFYPPFHDMESFIAKKHQPWKSRVAWCYGDLGILYVLLKVAETMKDQTLKQHVISKLKITAKRRDSKDAQIYDAGFCHGSTGAMTLFNELFAATSIQDFQETSIHWLRETLKLNSTIEEDGVNYGFLGSGDGRELSYCDSLLDGIGGLTLSYAWILNRFPECSNLKNIFFLD